MNRIIEEVIASYHRCRESGDFVDTFYRIFLSRSEKIRQLFAETNFEIQKLMLRESLLEMLCFEQGMPGSQQHLEQLGRRHRDLNVEPEMYDIWLDSLCQAVKHHDPEYRPELDQFWRQAMSQGIELMKSS